MNWNRQRSIGRYFYSHEYLIFSSQELHYLSLVLVYNAAYIAGLDSSSDTLVLEWELSSHVYAYTGEL